MAGVSGHVVLYLIGMALLLCTRALFAEAQTTGEFGCPDFSNLTNTNSRDIFLNLTTSVGCHDRLSLADDIVIKQRCGNRNEVVIPTELMASGLYKYQAPSDLHTIEIIRKGFRNRKAFVEADSDSSLLTINLACRKGRCPSGWSWFDGSCFLISEEEETFSSAEQSCEMEGGQLATVDSAERQTYIAKFVKNTNTRQFVQLHTNGNLRETLPEKYVQYVQDLGIDITNHTSVLFRIKLCGGGHMLLSKVKGDFSKETYHVIVGAKSNSVSVIKEDFYGPNRFVLKHPYKSYPLKCKFYQTFWMSWGVGVIRVGYGESVGKDEFMSWDAPTPHDVNFIAIGTGWGKTADWVFTTETFVPGKFWIEADVAGYSNWGVDEPSTTGNNTSSGGPCISMDMHEDMTWDEDDCEQLRNYVCQRNDE